MPTGIYKRTKPVWNKGMTSGFDFKAYQKSWYKAHKEEIIARSKSFAKKNKEKIKGYNKKYRESHKEEIRKKRWWQTPRGKETQKHATEKYLQSPKGKFGMKARNHNRRLKTQDLTLDIVKEVYADNVKLYGVLTCYLCLKPIPLGKDQLDHKKSLYRGGNNKNKNLGVACQFCNCSKRERSVDEFKKGVKCSR
jgi:5-methylcytosine-specific restriction endonuclease McrA